MARNEDGLRSEEVQAALNDAVAGEPARLRALLSRHGGLPGPRPALALAAAFGEAATRAGGKVQRLLEGLAADDAAPDRPEAFLPIAAAYGYTARWRGGIDTRGAQAALFALAGDERTPVRLGVQNALMEHAARGFADELVRTAMGWCDEDSRDMRWGAQATTLDALCDKGALAAIADRGEALALLTRVIDDVASAPRAAERSEGRRRALAAISSAVGAFVAAYREQGVEWFIERCEKAKHPDLRAALDGGIHKLRAPGAAPSTEALDRIRAALASSAKPPRDPSRIRQGTGRGKRGGRRGR